jgi:hypothetical protein
MPPIDYSAAKNLLEQGFIQVESQFLQGTYQQVDPSLISHFDTIFQSRTQAYREVLLGCVVARFQDRAIDIHKPYINQGPDAYNGRTLDERVVNPFLHDKHIPCSRGPFLSAFRRNVRFETRTRQGLRDREGFNALLALIDYLAEENIESNLLTFLHYLLFRFLELRQEASIPLSRLQRISLEQFDELITGLLSTPSGGRFPVILVGATFTAIKETFGLSWEIETQGINVANGASGVSGDITIKSGDSILLAAEITERPVDRNRIVATFNTKIAPQGIEDYLFFVRRSAVEGDALRQAHQYFSQGHEVNFLEIKDWIIMTLTTLGKRGRAKFNSILLDRLSTEDVPSSLKVAWNDHIARITSA